jgi:hypothetical protein
VGTTHQGKCHGTGGEITFWLFHNLLRQPEFTRDFSLSGALSGDLSGCFFRFRDQVINHRFVASIVTISIRSHAAFGRDMLGFRRVIRGFTLRPRLDQAAARS